MYCNVCGGEGHYASRCPNRDVKAKRGPVSQGKADESAPRETESVGSPNPDKGGLAACELDGEVVEVSRVLFDELVSDAEKWRKVRERQRRYMKRKRAGK